MLIHINKRLDTFSCLLVELYHGGVRIKTLVDAFIVKVHFVSCFETTLHGVGMMSFIYGLIIVDSILRLF